MFYLDDFPSPVPGGDGSYIRRDYGMSIADFYSKVWWPDLMKLAQQYSIRFTGVMIENYEDDTQSTPVRQPDTQQFRYYGSLLLQQGGEVASTATTISRWCCPIRITRIFTATVSGPARMPLWQR